MDPQKTEQAPESVSERVDSVDLESEVADLYDTLEAADEAEIETAEETTTEDYQGGTGTTRTPGNRTLG